MAKHTPGELECGELDGDSIYIWAYEGEGDDSGLHLATVSAEEVGAEQAEANAKLFTAAPDLLAALKASYATFYDKDCELGKQVAAAISKAEAESSCVS